jgi:hypothetical protein
MNKKFKVIAMGRVGTLAVNRYINGHPQLSLPSFNDCSKAFTSTTENIGGLLIDKRQQSDCQGIIIHDAFFFDRKHRKKLIALNTINVDAIVHLVRNPVDMVKSWINHINACASMGILGWSKITPSVEDFYSRYPEHFHTMKVGFQCRTFYKNYKRIRVIDFDSLWPEKIDQTMSTLYGFLGVDNSYKNEMSQDKQNTYTRQLLQKGIAFKLNNEVIEMVMAPVDLFFHKEKNSQPWITIHDTHKIYELCPTLPKLEGDLVFLPKSNHAHHNLSTKTRKMLSEGIKDIVGEVLPVWAKAAEQIAQDIEGNRVSKLSEADHSLVSKLMHEDLDIFCRYHPEFKTLWKV